MKMKKALVFDFDYTLGDSTEGIASSVNYALDKMGFEKRGKEEIKKTIGLSLKDTLFSLTEKDDEESAKKFAELFKEQADRVMVDNTRLYDGVKELLTSVKKAGYKIVILTTKYHCRIEQIFTKYDAIDLLDLIIGGDDVKVEKPNPEGLLWAIDMLSLPKEELLYVGDSLVDAKTAQRAGVDFCAVLTGTTEEKDFDAFPHLYVLEHVVKLSELLTI